MQAPRSTEERSPICPPFAPQIQKYISFCPLWVSENPEETLSHPKEFLIFAPFQPILAPLPLLPVVLMLPRESEQDRGRTEAGKPRTTQQNEEHNRTSCPDGARVLPMLLANRERKPTRTEGTRERERKKAGDKPTSPQKGVPPPTGRAKEAAFLITNSRQKISKKSPWGDLKKFSEKFFVGMFRGQRKTPRVSQRKGRSYNKS